MDGVIEVCGVPPTHSSHVILLLQHFLRFTFDLFEISKDFIILIIVIVIIINIIINIIIIIIIINSNNTTLMKIIPTISRKLESLLAWITDECTSPFAPRLVLVLWTLFP